MSVTKDFNINLDLYEPLDNEKFTVVEGDTANMLHIHVLGNGEPVDLTGCKILVIFAKGGQPVEQDSDGNGVTVSGDDNNIIDVELYSSSYTNGENTAQVQILSGDGYSLLATTAAFNFSGEKALANEDTLLSTIQWPLLMVALDKLDDIARGVQADMEIADDTDPAFVKNKPDIPTEPSDIGAADATHAARHASGGADAVSPASILAAGKSSIVTAALLATNWAGTNYTLAVAGVTAGSAVEILPGLAITEDQLDELQGANLQDGGQAAGSITLKAFGEVPTVDIPIRIIVRGDLYT